jgi:homoserine dehydrogenase
MRVDFDNAGAVRRLGAEAARVVVLKFGSSVLRTRDDLPAIASEIYRHVRDGRKVVAVVSALAGETDALIAEAATAGAGPLSRHAPRLVSLGEERGATLLAITCEAVGLDARILGARALSLRAGGSVNDAHPVSVNVGALSEELCRRDVVIVPGFVALSEAGEPVLLGRGGSDLTAVFLAAALDLAETTLMKDVDGVYDRDPARAGGSALRYRRLDWNGAREVAGKLLQPKAIEFAAAHGVAIRVLRLNGTDGTLVGAAGEAPSRAIRCGRMRVAIAGLGLIGEGAALRLSQDNPDYEICAALVREPFKDRPALRIEQVTNDPSAFFAMRPDVVIDALPDGAAGRALIRKALERGVSVVTANKQAIAGALCDLTALAATAGASFR